MELRHKLRRKARQTPAHQRMCKLGRPRARISAYTFDAECGGYRLARTWAQISGINRRGSGQVSFALTPSYWVYVLGFHGELHFRLKHQPAALAYRKHPSLHQPWTHHFHNNRKTGSKTSGRWYVLRLHRWMCRVDPNDSDVQPCMRPKYFLAKAEV